MDEFDALDRIDFGILVALRKGARLSNKELAALVRLALSRCLERVRRLRSRGALRGFHADMNPEALGIGLEALIAVRIQRHSRDQLERFQTHVLSLPETTLVYHVAGANDFLVHVQVRDAAHLRDFALDSFTTRPEVEHMETNLIFSHRQSYLLPGSAA